MAAWCCVTGGPLDFRPSNSVVTPPNTDATRMQLMSHEQVLPSLVQLSYSEGDRLLALTIGANCPSALYHLMASPTPHLPPVTFLVIPHPSAQWNRFRSTLALHTCPTQDEPAGTRNKCSVELQTFAKAIPAIKPPPLPFGPLSHLDQHICCTNLLVCMRD